MTNPLMEYLAPLPPQPELKYTGETAAGYDAKREQSAKWIAEQIIVEAMLSDLPAGSWVLDAPCGTGRFFDFYARKGLIVRAMDVSADMLQLATRKVKNPTAMVNGVAQFAFGQGDVRATGLQDKCVDAAVCVRITRWLSPDDCQALLREMQRVARKRIIWTARVANHPQARPRELFESVLSDGWRITRDEAGVDLDYRILEASSA